ncbi:MAG: nucleotide sugar dehydrogenase [Armatimonadetes bacterium]|nr:nucleotide sugar dehydrogenase [Armatimonadota bacterium]
MVLSEQGTTAQLRGLIDTRRAEICIVGLGYVGLPLAISLAEAGFPVRGLDVAEDKVQQLRDGQSYIIDVPDEAVARQRNAGRFRPETDPAAAINGADVVIITVPTPYTESKQPDLRYVLQAAEFVRQSLRPGMLVILESTTYPGTTQEIVLPRLEQTGLRCSEDFLLAYSPERIEPGNKRFGLKNTPKIVGGVSAEATEAAAEVYASCIDTVVKVGTPRVAEMAKLLENTFRHVNIALVNEMAILCHEMGINIWEVIDAAASKPFGFMPFYPGPGVGGHCIPIDPFYFAWKVQEFQGCARFIELAGQVNDQMPEIVVRLVQDSLNDHKKSMNGARVLVLGVAYKRDIDDMRETPAKHILERLFAKGADVSYHDPFVPTFTTAAGTVHSVPFTPETIAAADVVVIITDHTTVPYEDLLTHGQLIVDTRNALKGHEDSRIVRL